MNGRLNGLDADDYDVLVVGGGIVGAGVARDAAMRGLRTLLVDRSDFASGTSSRSSRLLHGGLRYLAQGRIAMVREASREKMILQRIAPHLTDPLAFIFPSRRGSGWPRWQLWIGTKIYDLLCGKMNFGRSHLISRSKLLELLPGLNPDGLKGAVRYFDALTNDARLVIDTLRSAERHGAQLRNYASMNDAQRVGDQWQCRIAADSGEETVTVTTRSVVNATGPWSDRIPHSQTDLRLTKGVHLVVDRKKLPVPDAVVMPDGKRILFAIPCGETVILGTTDTDYDGPLDRPVCDERDAREVLEVVNRVFPTADLTCAEVISTWAGLRPLVANKKGSPSDISRRHKIAEAEPGWWDVTGGKLTTFRLMAEETVNGIVDGLSLQSEPCRTAEQPLLNPSETEFSHIVSVAPCIEAVRHYCRNEWAHKLEDIMLRRTSWHYSSSNADKIAVQVSEWMAEELGWDVAAREDQLAGYRAASRDGLP